MAMTYRLPRLAISTMLLLVSCVGIWLNVWIRRKEVQSLESQVTSSSEFSRELAIVDPKQLAIVKRLPLTYDESIWDVYLPQDMELLLATHAIQENDATIPEPKSTTIVRSGTHKIELRTFKKGSKWVIVVLVDDTAVMQTEEADGWHGSGSYSGGSRFNKSTSIPIKGRVILFKRRYMPQSKNQIMRTGAEPADGHELWLNPVP